jgi:hypothetical protein
LQKATFHPIFYKSFSFFENILLDTWIDTQSAPTHVQPSNLKLRNWDEEIFQTVPGLVAQIVQNRGHG